MDMITDMIIMDIIIMSCIKKSMIHQIVVRTKSMRFAAAVHQMKLTGQQKGQTIMKDKLLISKDSVAKSCRVQFN